MLAYNKGLSLLPHLQISIRRNDEEDLAQLHNHGYVAQENQTYPNYSPRYSQEPEPSHASSIFDRLESRPHRNRKERVASAVANRAQRIPPPYQYQPAYAKMLQPARVLTQVPVGGVLQTQQVQSLLRALSFQLQPYEIDGEEDVSPFSEGICQCHIFHDFEISEICKYLGLGDPDDHILNYNTGMGIAEATPALKCKAFL
ncbi:hypothetical protein Adt_20832 [Abeliophyllum distichum]|uniref:Uncharacterized protein n=1 Tax=Abeliophyllum distichum TaxID=126358 RepID=A0ABD1SXU4_9LAMI